MQNIFPNKTLEFYATKKKAVDNIFSLNIFPKFSVTYYKFNGNCLKKVFMWGTRN